jgi:hypothetical protein
MRKWGDRSFIAAAFGLIAGAILHIVALMGGPKWIAFVGAPASVVGSAAKGTWLAPVGAIMITMLLVVFAAYAFSAAGLIRRLPWLRTTLTLLAAAFLLRGLIIVPALFSGRVNWLALQDLFIIGSSTFIFAIGAAIVIGLLSHRARRRIFNSDNR